MTRKETFTAVGSALLWVIMIGVMIQGIVACAHEKEPQLYDIYTTISVTYANGDADTTVVCTPQIHTVDYRLDQGDLKAYQYVDETGNGQITTAYSFVRAFKIIKTDTIIHTNNSKYLRIKK